MLAEVLERRLSDKRLIMPDIILIDGGRPQVTTILPIIRKRNLKIVVMGIAKRPDRLIFGVPGLPTIKPDQENWGFRLLVSLRDEAHRFARKYHLLLRDKKMML
jgi:excinuclease ABC subunit C